MSSRVPVRTRIIEDIRSRIASGELKPGERLPSIAEMRKLYDCSDTPVKAALMMLHGMGLIESHPGRATYVAEHPAV